MNSTLAVALILGGFATALFVAGYVRGTIHAIRAHRNESAPPEPGEHDMMRGWLIAFAVLCAALAIGLIGVSPALFFIGPFLAIGTAAVNGFAFFYDRVGA